MQARTRSSRASGRAGVEHRARGERNGRRASRDGGRVVDEVETGVAFVDGLGVGTSGRRAARSARLSEDGVLIVVATLASANGGSRGPPELIARGFGDGSGPPT
jgi:mRNA degradation ribonuclease J1/J2